MKQMKHEKSQKSSQNYRCEKCDYVSFRKYDYEKHILTAKHLSETKMKHEKSQKSSQKYRCEDCDYVSYRKYDYNKHILTAKHLSETNLVNCSQKSHKNSQIFSDNPDEIQLCLYCNKPFTSRTTLWRHKNKCILSNSSNTSNNAVDNNKDEPENSNDIILTVIKQNAELKEFLMEQHKQNFELQNKVIELCKISNITNVNANVNTNVNTNVNSNNKTFNLQVFLNETCKDAMNIMDFVESVKLQVSDLENVGRVGYIEGISNIIIKNLKALDVNKRPVHCADQKREVMYVKDDNIWEKEDETNKKLRKAVRMIAHKNICMLKAFREKYPDCEEYDSKKSSQYNKIVYEAMGGDGDDEPLKYNKIIKKIAKEVGIEKHNFLL
jgi:hypothetical protein